MSTALTVHRAAPTGVATALAPMNLDEMLTLGRTLVESGMMPKHVRSPAAAVAIILAGREMGLGPMLAIRSLALVEGKVVVSADLQLARFKADGGRAQFRALTPTEAVLFLRHPNGDEHTESFTIADAQAAGLAGKDVWKKYPKAMLRSRVITAGLKSVGYEPTAGAYDPDEIASPLDVHDEATGAVGSEARSETAPRAFARMTLDQALALPFPFKKGTAIHGRPLGECKSELLTSVAGWIVEQQAEKGDDDFHADTLAAINLVVADREARETEDASAVFEGEVRDPDAQDARAQGGR